LTLFAATKQAAPYSVGVRSNLGQEFRNRGDAQRALTEFETAVQLGATDVRLRSNLAALYQAAGDPAKARATIDECLHQQPRNPVVLLRAAAIADDQDDSRSAERYFILALGTTTDTQAWLRYATFLLKHKRYRDVLDIVDTCLYLDAFDANTWNLLGATQAERRQFADAQSAFAHARSLDAHSPDPEINLGRLAQDPQTAEAHFQRALAIAPDDPRVLYQLSRLAWQRGDHQLARQYLATAQEIVPASRVIGEALQKIDSGASSPYPASGSSSSGAESFR
jgi:Flp pilus assembly protein TadD